MEFYFKYYIHSLNFLCELSSVSVYFWSSLNFNFLSSFYYFNCSFKTNKDSLIFPMFSFSLLIRASFYFYNPYVNSNLNITYFQFSILYLSFPLHVDDFFIFFIHLNFFSDLISPEFFAGTFDLLTETDYLFFQSANL